VKTIVHEVVEAYEVLSNFRVSARVAHERARKIDEDLANKICQQCCPSSGGKMEF
jgi:hypothetical protein